MKCTEVFRKKSNMLKEVADMTTFLDFPRLCGS